MDDPPAPRPLCIIPARGGSKRIPRKNIKLFLGKPIISYVIETAKQSGLFGEVMVSTDDEEIASCAREFGANVPFLRSAKTSSDHASTIDVVVEVLDEYKKQFDRQFQTVCCLYPTAVLVTSSVLCQAQELLQLHLFDTVFPTLCYGHPIQRAFQITESSSSQVEMVDSSMMFKRTQDLGPRYHDAGQFYFFFTHPILKEKALFKGKTGTVVLTEMEAQDIDNLVDWELAELKYHFRMKKREKGGLE